MGEELMMPQKIEIGDVMKMKQVMDDAVVKAVLDLGYEEDHTLNNAKLSIMGLASVVAMLAQFLPVPFPESRPILAVCCISYFACSFALHLLVTYWERDIVLTTARKPGRVLTRGIRLRTDFPRFGDQYTVSVEENKKAAKPLKETWSVGNYFDTEGYFDEWGMGKSAEKMVQKLERKAKDKANKKSKKDRSENKKDK